MKICIPTETSEGMGAQVYGHFGSAPYFALYDTDKDTVEFIDNSNQHHSHGTCHPMVALAGIPLSAVVCGGMGARAVQKLNEAGIKAYMATPGTVAEIAAAFVKGGLKEITVEGACEGHGCH